MRAPVEVASIQNSRLARPYVNRAGARVYTALAVPYASTIVHTDNDDVDLDLGCVVLVPCPPRRDEHQPGDCPSDEDDDQPDAGDPAEYSPGRVPGY